MSEDQKLFIDEVKVWLLRGALGAIGTLLLISASFYVTMTKSREQHEYRITVLERNCARTDVMDAKLNSMSNDIRYIRDIVKIQQNHNQNNN
jgi:hypothetical protein